MLINIILLAIGLFALVKASDVFVDSASSFATSMRAPKTLIALTIAAFGTCAPELAISFNSIAAHNYDMTLANVIGSCVVNILLIVGIATIVNPIKVKNKIIQNELPLLVITSTAFCIALNDSLFGNYRNGLSRLEAGAFVFLFGVFILYIILAYIKNRPKTRGRPPKAKYSLLRSTIYIIITIFVIGIASDLTVDNAAALAEKIGISEKVISMTVIVIGTSLPELVMTAGAAKKGEFELAVGNIIGTNIFNICIVLGLPILIFGGFESSNFNIIDSLAVLLTAVTYYLCSRSGKKLIRAEGVLMVVIFLCYYTYVLLN
jgi:cation:H+ antiporter